MDACIPRYGDNGASCQNVSFGMDLYHIYPLDSHLLDLPVLAYKRPFIHLICPSASFITFNNIPIGIFAGILASILVDISTGILNENTECERDCSAYFM